MIVVITPTYAQLFLYYIHLAYMFRPSWSSSGRLRLPNFRNLKRPDDDQLGRNM